jgi:hypothetical protein
MLEGEVDHAVGLSGRCLETIEVVEIAATDLGSKSGDGLSRGVRAGETDDLMCIADEFGDDGGGDVA